MKTWNGMECNRMRKNVKRMVYVIFTILALLVTTKSMAEAYESQYIEVVNEGAPIRTEPYKEADVIMMCSEGSLLEYEGGICNSYGNGWYIVNIQGNSGYIYEENVVTHECDYNDIYYNGTTYEYCGCGNINVLYSEKISVERATAIATYAAEAAAVAALDGPVLLGDAIGGAILIIGAADSILNGVNEEVVTVAEEIDLEGILEKESVCTDTSFRKVIPVKNEGKLTYVDDECMDLLQAFFYARFVGDTYTLYQENAYEEAALYGSCYVERDRDRPEYWYHYHFGESAQDKVGYHMFFGTNEFGEVPVEY